MRLLQFLSAVAIAFTLCLASPMTASAAPMKLKTGWLDEHETFLMWYATEKGWDKEEGLDIELLYFDSGMAALAALPAGEWVLGGFGAVPAMMGNLRYDLYVIGNGNDESMTNAIMVRPDSPIMKTKGFNKEYPEVYGSPETVKGKEFLVTTVSSAHFALVHWLRVLGLNESDIIIKNMDQAQALGAFSTGIGEGAALWAPHMFIGEDKGWKVVATPKTAGMGNPIVLVADKKFADANPEVVAKFLRIYMRAVNMIQNEPVDSLIADYQRFFLEWAGKEYSADMAKRDILAHPVFNYEQQLELFDSTKGQSVAQKWQADIAYFFAQIGRITDKDVKKVGSGEYATDKFLKLVETPIPAYN